MPAPVQLHPTEARVLGVLVEKELTTPDQYPLSLNALAAGASQKSNRDPVVAYSPAELEVALKSLQSKQLAGGVQIAGSRIERYRHNARQKLGLDEPGIALVAELMLRGPQTLGELRARASRMSPFESLEAVHGVLDALAERGLVRDIGAAPGSRATRYEQLLCPDLHRRTGSTALSPSERAAAEASAAPRSATAASIPRPGAPRPSAPGLGAAPASGDLAQRVAALEATVARLRVQLESLSERLGEPLEPTA